MAHKKRPVPKLIVRQNAFSRFLKENYGYTDVRQYTEPKKFSSRLNSIFLAKDRDGKDIFIKACRYGDMSENEYRCTMALWEQAPENFARPLAYYAGKKHAFCSTEYRPGKDLRTLIELEGGVSLTAEQKAQIVEDLYSIFQALQRADIVHCDFALKNMLLHNGRVILIDCQLSARRGNTKRISYFSNILKLCLYKWLAPVNANVLTWEDTAGILHSIQKVGTDDAHRERFDAICAEVKASIGKLRYVMPYPSLDELNHCIKVSYLRSLFHPKSKLRSRYRHVTEMLKYIKSQHPSIIGNKKND